MLEKTHPGSKRIIEIYPLLLFITTSSTAPPTFIKCKFPVCVIIGDTQQASPGMRNLGERIAERHNYLNVLSSGD